MDKPIPSYLNKDPLASDYQLYSELLGSGNLISHIRCDSSPRVQMRNSHNGQSLVIKGATVNRQLTGTEREYGKYTFAKTFENNCSIISVIERYRRTIGVDAISESPERIYIYEDNDTKEVGVLNLPKFHCQHQHFGFEYKQDPQVMQRLYDKARIPAGTIVANTPAVDENGDYATGIELNMALMSVPGVIEDGIVIADDVLDSLSAQGFERRSESCGKNFYFLNLYGDPNKPDEYKPFPDIGEHIRPDGLLFALRRYDPVLAPVEMSPSALREPDYIYDRLVYAVPNARVIDVMIQHDDAAKIPTTPVGMERQMVKYHTAATEYYNRILEEYHLIRKRNGVTSHQFSCLVVEALIYINRPNRDKQRANKTNRRNALDDWTVQVTFQYTMTPTIGGKMAGGHGNKGVICQIWPGANMPVDSAGNRADFIMDADSIIKRMNLGVPYEQYFGAALRDVTYRVREAFGVARDGSNAPKELPKVQGMFFKPRPADTIDPELVKVMKEYVLGFYEIISPWMKEIVESPEYGDDFEPAIRAILSKGIYLWMPPNNPIDYISAVLALEERYKPTYGPVTYTPPGGVPTVTKLPIMIGGVYVSVLEKTGGDYSGAASAKLQHHGIPAKITKMDKHAYPCRASPVRLTGEAEIRWFSAACGGTVAADLVDQSNNPVVHKEIIANIIESPTPTNIEVVIDRNKFPIGNGRNILVVKHLLECAGMQFVYEDVS